MGFANHMAPGIFESVFIHSDLKNFKWRIQYGGQVNVINFYKPLPPYWIRHFEFF